MLRSHKVTFRPLEQWTGPKTTNRKRSPFRASYKSTCDLLDRELLHLSARNVVIQADCDASKIRLDGMPRASARISPRVMLSFDSPTGSLSFPCDRFANWDCNIRAIALTLEHLRAVNRYGVTRNAEQYRGWSKLGHDSTAPAGETVSSTATDPDHAAGFLVTVGGGDAAAVIRSAEAYRSVYRRAAAACHPDRWGGDHQQWRKFQAATAVLDKHHGA